MNSSGLSFLMDGTKMDLSDSQRQENYQEYILLSQNPLYTDVKFDYESGGVSAIHCDHRFDSAIGPFGVKIGEYEKIVVENLRKRGHCITLESELAPNGVKTPDGWLDGMVMDIKSTDGHGKWAIKDKFHSALKQGVECVVLYFHSRTLYSHERILDGWEKFQKDSSSKNYQMKIKKVICVVEDEVIENNFLAP